MKILCFGSSSVYGAGDPEGGWVARLRCSFDQAVPENSVCHDLVYNLGISGGTSEDLRRRFAQEMADRVDTRTDNTVIIGVGGNDAAWVPSQQAYRVSPERFAENLEFFVTTARVHSPYIAIQELTPVNDAVTIEQSGRDRSKSNVHNQEFNEKLHMVCQRLDVPVIRAWDTFMTNDYLSLLCDDGVHPNAKGHELLFHLAQDMVNTLIRG